MVVDRAKSSSRWLFVPRGMCVLHVPVANQHLIRSALPTSWGFVPAPKTQPSSHPLKPKEITYPLPASNQSPFVTMFDFVGTIDNTNYLCVPAALSFRSTICGAKTTSCRTASSSLSRAGTVQRRSWGRRSWTTPPIPYETVHSR